jgi:sodium pump decarboxylase gamma subunit
MEQGITVLVVGMTTVFAFLFLMVVCMLAAARFFKTFAKWFPEEAAATPPDPLAEVAAAIAAVQARMQRSN